MLINFTFSNFKSFRAATEFSMVAIKDEGQDDASLLEVPGMEGEKLLPVAAVYGGNAAGKTSFTQALMLLQYMVCVGRVEHVQPFRLDEVSRKNPTSFVIELVTEGQVWEYTLRVCGSKVYTESLICVSTQQSVYNRGSDGTVVFNSAYFAGKTKDELWIANAMAGSIPQEQVLLHALRKHQGVLQDVATVCNKVFRWFERSLMIKDANMIGVHPGVVRQRDAFADLLRDAGTGIHALKITKLPYRQTGAPPEVVEALLQSLPEGEMRPLSEYVLVKEDGELYAYKCESQHELPSGQTETFDLKDESDGTRSFMNLLPVLTKSISQSYVFVIDELDRSLHTKLSRRLIEKHLELVQGGARHQLIFTTHDVMLLDADLLRKDEIWLVDRYEDGTSEMTAFVEYNEAEAETNIRKSYLQGRIGGVPDINL